MLERDRHGNKAKDPVMQSEAHTRELIVGEIPRLRRYARSLCLDRDDADDLVQMCLERALSRIGYWRAGTNIRAWLLTIMHNLHVNNIKSASRSPGHSGHDVEELGSTATASDRGSLVLRDLRIGLARLSPEHREALLLVGMEQYSYKEAARIAGISTGTLMSRLHRARKQLAQVMEDDSRTRLKRVK